MLKKVSLEIEKGKTTAIIGVNGSGKSTLLRALGRLIKFEGEVFFEDENLRDFKPKALARKLALLPQNTLTPSDITVYDLVAMGRFPQQSFMQRGLTLADKEFLEQLMFDTEVWDLRNEKLDQLSGGQRQRVFITMILAQDSEIILLDEPTTYLDMVHQLEILSLLKRCATELKKTVVYVIHDLDHVARFADNMIVLKDGELACQGKVDEVFSPEMIQDCFGLRVEIGADVFSGKRMITGIQNVQNV